jgi:sugar-specific transcriptional regulator TrmB
VSKFQEGKDATFDTVSLMKEFRVKQRRVYDLMNIMEGCGCVKKISKKKYEWVGPGKSIFIETVSQKGDATSLRQITARIKLLISKEKGLVTFSKIN